MKCYKCGRGIAQGLSMFPIDSPGEDDRRWACEDCIKPNELDLDNVERDIISRINPDVIYKIEHMGFTPHHRRG